MTYDTCKILSPVGSMDVLDAAVFSGADFVYLSGKNYGARDYADNFSYDELRDATNFCHKYNVKVFVTVNVSILEDEIPDVVDYVYYLYLIGVDGVIVEDIGLASVIMDLIPSMSVHASTQMTVYDYSFVKWLCENGFDSVNLSREVSLDNIRSISDRLKRFGHDINLEVFAHGALCYCYSGQCLMSSFYGGRSGNRGLCAQPCRMRYSFRDYYNTLLASDDYLLSTKDLCTYNNVGDLVDAGANCLKIEGRMKSREYVSCTTFAYHNAVNGCCDSEDYLLLNLAFNRGLTEGYVSGKSPREVIGRSRSGNTGYPIGRVIKSTGREVTIKFTNKSFPTRIVNGDGLKFELDGESCGMYVSRIFSQNKNKIVIAVKKGIHIEKDSMVYITYSKYLRDKTKSIINERNIHKTSVDLEISMNNESQMEVNARCDMLEKNVKYTSKEKIQKAKNKPLTQEKINTQLRKTGNTTYKINKIKYNNLPENIFMPISTLNNIRREIIKKIDHEIMNTYIPEKKDKEETKKQIQKFKTQHYTTQKTQQKEENWNIYINNYRQAELLKKYNHINTIYYDGNYNHKNMKEYTEQIGDELIKIHQILPEKELVWILPQLLQDKDLPHISETIVKLKYNNIDIKIQTDNIGIAENINTTKYGNNLNIYNNYSIRKLSKTPGFKKLVISNEISLNDIRKLNNKYCDLEYIIFGHVQLMITKDNYEDLIDEELTNTYYLTDKRNNKFKIKKDCNNNSHIYDYRILNLDDKIEQLRKTSINNYTLDLRFFNITDTEKIIKHFQEIIKTNKTSKKLNLEENTKFFQANIEKGLYKQR
ncbi:U32 family peptidase [Methanosphaera sp. ISO3-F5]|uniref:peptidase U32 family protein n=1 Tax=Methanosphaera sp. ISO3-F5 TaxID=1452353 RepID=UPI002B25A6B9|nr:U32 family peptidase [Methanosphaera sp. ISO3-F5]WQH63191.1 U32 family peptidase [Methanosphaera sp. ISO3-F5]